MFGHGENPNPLNTIQFIPSVNEIFTVNEPLSRLAVITIVPSAISVSLPFGIEINPLPDIMGLSPYFSFSCLAVSAIGAHQPTMGIEIVLRSCAVATTAVVNITEEIAKDLNNKIPKTFR